MRSKFLRSMNTLPLRALTLILVLYLSACASTIMRPGPPTVSPQLTNTAFITADGSHLPFKQWLPDSQPPEGILIALHGFNDYSNFFESSANFFQKNGIASFAYDQRGFGQSPHIGFWAGTQAMTHDLKQFTRLIKQRYPEIPVYLLGESMGGAVVLVTMTQKEAPDVDGIILAAPAVWGTSTMPWYQQLALSITRYTVPWLKLSGSGLKIKPSDNTPMLRKLGKDPLIIKETRVDTIHGLTQLMTTALQRATQLQANTLILYGERDDIIPKAPTAQMLQNLPANAKTRQTVAIYENGYHMLLRDLNAAVPQEDILNWMKQPDQPLPSGADKRSLNKLMCSSKSGDCLPSE